MRFDNIHKYTLLPAHKRYLLFAFLYFIGLLGVSQTFGSYFHEQLLQGKEVVTLIALLFVYQFFR